MKKVAIVNRTNLKNYGSVLQAYALCETVSNLGCAAEIIWEEGSVSKHFDFRLRKIMHTGWKLLTHPQLISGVVSGIKEIRGKEISEETVALYDRFVRTNVHRKFYPRKDFKKSRLGEEYDYFICGSDQVWSSTTTYVDPLMYLRFAPKEKRIAYAPSLGRDYIPDYNRRQMRRFISDIPKVSVREDSGRKLIKELTGRDVPVVLDPTLLISPALWDGLKARNISDSDYVLCYFLTPPSLETQNKLARAIKGKRVVALNSRLDYLSEKVEIDYPACGPSEFLYYVSNASQVYTDSYHGMLFSVLYKKDFWSIEREYGEFDQSSRQKTVLTMLELEERYVTPSDSIKESEINYPLVIDKLSTMKEKSLAYLRDSIGV